MTNYVTADDIEAPTRNGTIKLHGPAGFEGMRKAGLLAAEILDALVPMIVPGVTTQEIDDIVLRMTLDAGALPATLNYRGYTHSCCTSINHVVCHGIPGPNRATSSMLMSRRLSMAGMATPTAPIWSGMFRSKRGDWSRSPMKR